MGQIVQPKTEGWIFNKLKYTFFFNQHAYYTKFVSFFIKILAFLIEIGQNNNIFT